MKELYLTGKALQNFQRMKTGREVRKELVKKKVVKKLKPTDKKKLEVFVQDFKREWGEK